MMRDKSVRVEIIVAQSWCKDVLTMVTITFPDRNVEKRALAFLLGQFSGRVLRSGQHLVPEAALEALADYGISFVIQGEPCDDSQSH